MIWVWGIEDGKRASVNAAPLAPYARIASSYDDALGRGSLS